MKNALKNDFLFLFFFSFFESMDIEKNVKDLDYGCFEKACFFSFYQQNQTNEKYFCSHFNKRWYGEGEHMGKMSRKNHKSAVIWAPGSFYFFKQKTLFQLNVFCPDVYIVF